MTLTELKYEVLKAAPAGAKSPKSGDFVTVHYTGWLFDESKPENKGQLFDSSIGRGEFTFQIGVGQVIKGWDEGVMKMKIGDKARLTIPPQLGYGSRGAGRIIKPNATLVFEVDLLNVRPGAR
jgi:FKBP-type peptidyl-prolyl cis-trans isomerase